MRLVLVFAAFGLTAFLSSAAPQVDSRATVKITTKLGVEASFEATYPYSSAPRPVDRLLEQFKKEDDPGVLLAWTSASYLIVPLGVVRTATVTNGQARVMTTIGDFTGKLASGLQSADGRRYDLASVVKMAVSHPGSQRADGKDPQVVLKKPVWKLTIASRPERSFRIQNVEFRFGFYTTEGYIRGGEDSFYDSGVEEFILRTGGEEIQALLTDFDELAFSHAVGKLMVKLKTPNGTVTSGEFVVTQTDDRGRHVGHTRYLVGRLSEANACFVLVGDKEAAWTLTRLKE